MLYAQCVGLAEDVAYPLNPPSSQATRSHPAKSFEPKSLNETMWRERKVSPFRTLSTGLHYILIYK